MEFEVIQHKQTPLTPEIYNISEFLKENRDIVDAFEQYAMSRENCIGLAANQCSVDGIRFNVRMALIKDINTHEGVVAIAPKITKYYGVKRIKAEGCLTWGKIKDDFYVIIAGRNHFVDVEYYTPDGTFHQETHKGYQAQVWQHEINHLNGVEETVTCNEFVLDDPIDKNTLRNDKCPCGSGKKYKFCCIEID